jgi:hypothetical protein
MDFYHKIKIQELFMDENTFNQLLIKSNEAMDTFRKTATPEAYWLNQQEILKNCRDRSLNISMNTMMSHKTLHKPFSI